ncbi:ATP-binding cassette domain-containing protein [Aeromicrobium sp. P5_D10]
MTKTFPGVTALADVSLEVLPGEVHALVGENGAGKSTLMAIAAGALEPNEGTVKVNGDLLEGADPTQARDAGLGIVYQHPALLPDLTVAENFLLGVPEAVRPRARDAVAWTAARLEESGAKVDPRTRVVDLSSAQRQLVEIARAVAANPSVLILDEPTESLTRADIDILFTNIRRLCETGTSVVYISHRIPDVKAIANRLTLLRDGRTRGTFQADEVTEDEIVRLIVGRSIDAAFPDKASNVGELILEARGFSGGRFDNIDLDVRAGEIVGLAGIEGNGQTDFIRALAGLEKPSSTELKVKGKAVTLHSVAAAQDVGIVYMPGDKLRDGLFVEESVRENASVLALGTPSRGGFISGSSENVMVKERTAALEVKTPSLDTKIGSLSGGNQQKVVLARALMAQPSLLLAEEPTQGVDAGVRVEMYQNLRDVAADGNGVVVLSSDALELAGLCDRVVIFSRGTIVKELAGDQISESAITQSALTSTALRREDVSSQKKGGGLRRFVGSDIGPAAIILAAIIVLAIYTSSRNSLFLGEANISSTLFLAATLIIVAYGQLIVLMTAGIDLSVGPLIGTCTVIASFLLTETTGPLGLVVGVAVLFAAAAGVGLVNAGLFRWGKLNPIVATLVTFTVLQGAGLLMRPSPDGLINSGFTEALNSTVAGIPVVFILAVAAAVVLEWALRRTMLGIRLRGLGSDEDISRKLGTNVNAVTFGAYVLCSLFAAVGSLLVAASIGLGDASSGASYTFASITAVILAGAAITGGRGSFIAALLGAVLIQTILSATTFLELSESWRSWLTGALMLIAAASYSVLQKKRS